jgi:hypothetical protein
MLPQTLLTSGVHPHKNGVLECGKCVVHLEFRSLVAQEENLIDWDNVDVYSQCTRCVQSVYTVQYEIS